MSRTYIIFMSLAATMIQAVFRATFCRHKLLIDFYENIEQEIANFKLSEDRLRRCKIISAVPVSVFIDLVRHFNMFFPISKDITLLNFLLKFALTSIGTEALESNILNDLKVSTAFDESPFHPHNSRVYLLLTLLTLSIKFIVESNGHLTELVRETINLLSGILRVLTHNVITGNVYASISAYLLLSLFGDCAIALRSLLSRNHNETCKEESPLELEFAFTGALTATLNTPQEALANYYLNAQWKVGYLESYFLLHLNIFFFFFTPGN